MRELPGTPAAMNLAAMADDEETKARERWD
jgi:hypothetical protein